MDSISQPWPQNKYKVKKLPAHQVKKIIPTREVVFLPNHLLSTIIYLLILLQYIIVLLIQLYNFESTKIDEINYFKTFGLVTYFYSVYILRLYYNGIHTHSAHSISWPYAKSLCLFWFMLVQITVHALLKKQRKEMGWFNCWLIIYLYMLGSTSLKQWIAVIIACLKVLISTVHP